MDCARASAQAFPPGLAKTVAEASAKAMAKEAQCVAQQGLGRPIISAEIGGRRVVAVRNKLYYIQGKTFGDYLRDVLDPAWGNTELKKPLRDRHPILQWYDSICNFQRRSGLTGDSVVQVEGNGASSAWLRLAYDLYALDHNAELQKKLVGRLKNLDMFPGARYETYVAAAMIRAGFDIVFEDEDDRSATHCEFVATCKTSGNMYSVEAKHRNRSDATGTLKFRLGRRLQGALRKQAAHPRIVFLDVGIPDDQMDDTTGGSSCGLANAGFFTEFSHRRLRKGLAMLPTASRGRPIGLSRERSRFMHEAKQQHAPLWSGDQKPGRRPLTYSIHRFLVQRVDIVAMFGYWFESYPDEARRLIVVT